MPNWLTITIIVIAIILIIYIVIGVVKGSLNFLAAIFLWIGSFFITIFKIISFPFRWLYKKIKPIIHTKRINHKLQKRKEYLNYISAMDLRESQISPTAEKYFYKHKKLPDCYYNQGEKK